MIGSTLATTGATRRARRGRSCNKTFGDLRISENRNATPDPEHARQRIKETLHKYSSCGVI